MEQRRKFLGTLAAAALVTACGDNGATGDDSSAGGENSGGRGGGENSGGAGAGGGGRGGGGAVGAGGAGGHMPMECTPTADNLLGPYYRPDAPFRDDLVDGGMAGTRVTISGTVYGPDCETIGDALIDVWQADADGGYDNDGVGDPPPNVFVLRGRLHADGEGAYAFRTIIPGHYLNGAQFRPAHVHVTVSAPGYAPLTTQLYFDGDPYNEIDPFIIESLIMQLTPEGGDMAAHFDFVLQPL